MKVIRAHKWLVILCVVIVTVPTVVASYFRAPTYQSEAQVLLTQQVTGATLMGAPQAQIVVQPAWDVATQVGVMQSRPVLEQVIRTLHLKMTPDELLSRVNVEADGQTNIVTIVVTEDSPKRAATIANTMASTYVAASQDAQRATYKATADTVDAQVTAAQLRIAGLEAYLVAQQKAPKKSNEASGYQAAVELQVAKLQYQTLADKLNQLRTNQQLATGSGSILASAAADPKPVSPSPMRNGAIALVLGLVLGIGVAFLAEVIDNTIRSSEVAAEIYGAPVLGDIPIEKPSKEEGTARLTLVQHPGGPAAEAYRVLRNNLGFINFEHDMKTVLVTSAAPSEGKSTVAANLATVLSQAGKRVILVDCDFHRPVIGSFFGVTGEHGLSDALAGNVGIADVLQQPEGLERLWIVTAGTAPPNPSEMLASTELADMITTLREQADWIILDSAPLLAVADAAAVAHAVDGVLVVARVGVSTRDAARKSHEQLMNVGARIFGVVLWGLERDAVAKNQYGYNGYTSK